MTRESSETQNAAGVTGAAAMTIVVLRRVRAAAAEQPPALLEKPPSVTIAAMRVLIMADMEGISGIINWDQVTGGAPLYEEGRRLYTE